MQQPHLLHIHLLHNPYIAYTLSNTSLLPLLTCTALTPLPLPFLIILTLGRPWDEPEPWATGSQVINLFIALSSNNGVISSPKLQVGVTLCNQGTCYFANPSTQHGASIHCIHIEQGIDDRCTGYYSSCNSYGPYGAVGSGWATCAEE